MRSTHRARAIRRLKERRQHHEASRFSVGRWSSARRICRVPQQHRRFALERRVSARQGRELSLLDTIEVIMCICVHYEKYHCVRVFRPHRDEHRRCREL